MPKAENRSIIPATLINQKIYLVRRTHVMLDADLAKL
jgi:hypothetical protein